MKESKENNNKSIKIKKTVKFAHNRVDDDGETWQTCEIKKLENRITELLVENEEQRGYLEINQYN